MSQYPITHLPQNIKEALSKQPTKPIFKENYPLKPTEPQPINVSLLSVGTVLVIAVTLTLSSVGIELALGFLSLGSLAIFALAQQQRYSFAKRHRDYQEQLRKYEQKVAESHKPENVEEYRRQEVRRALNQTIPHNTKCKGARKGKSEPKFEQHLNHYFPRQIYTHLALIIPNFKCPYTADFTYIDKEIKLFIDIEIDEPYIYNTREPIHYIGYWKDQIRNDFFNNKGWIVIRFSEEQVVRYPDSCCKFIAQQIAEITRNSAITSQFAQTPDLQPQQQWTEKEAIEMAYRKERDDYL
jgi:hypothetical protein